MLDDNKDYMVRLSRARRKRNRQIDPRYLLLAVCGAVVIGVLLKQEEEKYEQ